MAGRRSRGSRHGGASESPGVCGEGSEFTTQTDEQTDRQVTCGGSGGGGDAKAHSTSHLLVDERAIVREPT